MAISETTSVNDASSRCRDAWAVKWGWLVEWQIGEPNAIFFMCDPTAARGLHPQQQRGTALPTVSVRVGASVTVRGSCTLALPARWRHLGLTCIGGLVLVYQDG